jgi:hypothetical protein
MGDNAEVEPSAGTAPAVDDGGAKDIPEWLGKLVWRSLWQLVAVALITLVALRFVYLAQDLVRWLILSFLLSFASSRPSSTCTRSGAGAVAPRPD